MEELVTKGPNRFEREEAAKALLEEAEALGRTEKAGLKSEQTEGEEWGNEVAFKLRPRDGDGQGKGPSAWQLPAGDPEGI